MKRSHSVVFKAPEGQMVVSREKRSVDYLVRCSKGEAHLYELMSEAEARDLEAQWKEEDKAKAKAEAEAGEARESEEASHAPNAPSAPTN